MRRILKVVGWFSLSVLLLIGVLLGYAYTHEEELKARAVAALEAGLVTKVDIKSIDYNVFAHFPNAALRCRGVVLYDTFNRGDTLISAEEVSFEIGLLSLLRGQVAFDQVGISDGRVHLLRDENGVDNFHFWKITDENEDSADLAFNLEVIRLKNIHFIYDDRLSKVYVETRELYSEVKGGINGATIDVSGAVRASAAYVSTDGTPWVHRARIDGSLSAIIDTEADDYSFNDIDLDVAGVRLVGSTRVQVLEDGVDLRLSADVKSIEYSALSGLLPPEQAAVLEPYDLSGKGRGTVRVNGRTGNGQTPEWSVMVEVRKGAASHRESGKGVSGISALIRANGDNGGNLFVDSFEGRLGGGLIGFNGALSDFATPSVLLTLRADLRLNELARFLDVEGVDALSGRALVELGIAGILPFRQQNGEQVFDAAMLRQNKYNGKAELSDVSVQTPAMARPIERMNGRLNFTGDYADVEALVLRVGDSDYSFSGEVHNILPWLLAEDEVLRVDAACKSGLTDLASFLTDESAESSAESYKFNLPETIDLRVSARIDELRFRAFSARNFVGDIELNRRALRFSQLKFDAADGKVELDLTVVPFKEGFKLSSAGSMQQVDIRRMFVEFEEFGQEFITSFNLRGRSNLDLVFGAEMSSSLEIDAKSIVSYIDLIVENGELIGLQSMQSISDYMRSNKLIAPFVNADLLEERLRHIRFETLENRIEIKNERIYFPMMDVRSSAMDIKASGSHWFDSRIDYTVALYLRDILVRKDRKDFGEIEDDGLGHRFFLSMAGTTEEPTFGYDRQARREVRQAERQAERETLKRIITEDLNPFKKRDKPEDRPGNNAGGSSIKVEWGDEENEPQPKKSEQPASEGKRRWKLFGGDDDQEKVAPPPADDDDF